MTRLGFHSPVKFFYHHDLTDKRKLQLHVDGMSYIVKKITAYAPTETKDVSGLHLVNMGFTNKVHINNDTAIIY